MNALEEAAPLLAKVHSQTARELYVGRLASTLGLKAEQVVREVRAAAAGRREERAPRTAEAASPTAAPVAKRVPPRDELEALMLLVLHADLAAGEAGRRVPDLLVDAGLRTACRMALAALEKDARIDVPVWLESVPADIRDAVAAAVMDGRFTKVHDVGRVLATLVASLELANVEQQIKHNDKELEDARQRGDGSVMQAVMKRQLELIQTKEALRGRRR
jgi:DNA primase